MSTICLSERHKNAAGPAVGTTPSLVKFNSVISMARLPPSGVTIATPYQEGPPFQILSKTDLHNVLVALCPGAIFSEMQVAEIYIDIQLILGRWHANQGRPGTASLAAALTNIGNDLDSIAAGLASIENGIHHIQDVELVSKLISVLAAEGSACGSRRDAQELIGAFRRDAIEISNACRKGAADFKQYVGKSGQPRLSWYDDFKTLLLKIARLGGVEASLGKDRITYEPTGWLFEAARRLEIFLDPAMRSPNANACVKRLERAFEVLK